MAEEQTNAFTAVGLAELRIEQVGKSMPFTIALGIMDGTAFPIVKKGAKLPVRYEQLLASANSRGIRADFPLLMGNRPLTKDNAELCSITIKAPRFSMKESGHYRLHVDVEADGRILIYANEPDTGKAIKAQIGYDHEVITKEMIAGFEKEAAAAAEEDKATQQKIDKLRKVDKHLSDVHGKYWDRVNKRLTLAEKRQYQLCCDGITRIVRKGPAALTDENQALLKTQLEEFDEWEKKFRGRV